MSTEKFFVSKSGSLNQAKSAILDHIIQSELLIPLSNNRKRLIVGWGSGSTLRSLFDRLCEAILHSSSPSSLIPISIIPSSTEVIHHYHRALQLHPSLSGFIDLLPLIALPSPYMIDIAIDGCDAIDADLNALKGGGGGEGGAAIIQEKLLALSAKRFLLIGEQKKYLPSLTDKGTLIIPIEVLPVAAYQIKNRLIHRYGTIIDQATELRMAVKKAGPIVTDNGNFIIDIHINKNGHQGNRERLFTIIQQINQSTGVVGDGLFISIADEAYIASEDGSVYRYQRIGERKNSEQSSNDSIKISAKL